MSTHKRCDGCKAELTRLPVDYARGHKQLYISGARDPDAGQGLSPLPDGEFDLCRECALIAFGAVKAAAKDRAA